MNYYLKGSVFLALGFALTAMLLGLWQIGMQLASYADPKKDDGRLGFAFASQEPGVTLLRLDGIIQDRSRVGDGIESLLASLKEAKEASHVRAVLLAINSPGGTVGASKKLYQNILDFRKTKPIVALVSGLAASGGYYAASACSRIVASEAAVVGSIGVISFHMELQRFLKNYGVKVEAFKSGRFKDLGSPFRKMTALERNMQQRLLEEFYQIFLKDVAAGRKRSVNVVRRRWADGRVFSGRQALKLKMVDALGEQEVALDEIKKLLKTDEELQIIIPPRDWQFYMDMLLLNYIPSFSNALQQDYVTYRELLQSSVLYLYPSAELLQLWGGFYLGAK